ncbi:MAG: hypothetical protein KKB62_03785 [Nanoarchaeota archaeon]|nr:hypothetical protein [Nanoarchaeota archaeon]
MKKIILILFSALLTFSSCSKDEGPVESPGSDPNPPNSSGITLRENAVELTSTETSMISSVTNNSITFSSSNEVISKIKAGDIIVAGISSKTPNGLLRKVTGLSKVGNTDGWVFNTIMASLAELIQAGKITFNKNLFSFNQSLSNILYSGNGGEVSIAGNFNETGNISGYLDFNSFPKIGTQLKFSFTGAADFHLTANVVKSFSNDYYITYYTFPAVLIWGSPPVVVTPALRLSARLQGDLSGEIYSGAKDVLSNSVTITYSDGWSSQNSLGNTFTFEGASVTAEANAKLYIIGSVEFLIYETIGPSVGIAPYTRLNAVLLPNPKWTLYKGVDASAGISTGWLSPIIPGKTWTFNLSEGILASGTFGGGSNLPPLSPSNPYPSDGAQNVPSPVTLTWDCSDPDGDPLHYDLIVGIFGDITIRIENINQNYHNIGSFTGNKHVFWKVIAFDSQGDSTEGNTWTFWTGSGGQFSTFTDPRDGRTYQTVKIGDQWWFAENLDYNVSGSVYYNNDPTYSEYGRLYSWEDAMNACPPGWHLPSKNEWTTMINFIGGYDVAGGKLKETGTIHWNYPNIGATNEYGFSAYGGGYFFSQSGNGNFYKIKEKCCFWTSSLVYGDPNSAFDIELWYNESKIIPNTANGINPSGLYFNMESVRPIKDN